MPEMSAMISHEISFIIGGRGHGIRVLGNNLAILNPGSVHVKGIGMGPVNLLFVGSQASELMLLDERVELVHGMDSLMTGSDLLGGHFHHSTGNDSTVNIFGKEVSLGPGFSVIGGVSSSEVVVSGVVGKRSFVPEVTGVVSYPSSVGVSGGAEGVGVLGDFSSVVLGPRSVEIEGVGVGEVYLFALRFLVFSESICR